MTIAAMVVGGGTGMGRATAERLLKRGVAVMLTGRREGVLSEARGELERAVPGARVEAVAADSSVMEEAQRVTDATVEAFGGLDLCVNCAGTYEPTGFLDFDEGSWRAGIGPCLDAVVFPSVAAANVMAKGNGGRFVLISSICALMSEPQAAHYNVAKAGVSALARSMALDLAKNGIVVNSIAPGWVETQMVQYAIEENPDADFSKVNMLGRMGSPDEIANVAEYLGLDSPEFLTGETIFVDGGQVGFAQMP